MSDQQSFERHAKVVPLYHYITYGILLIYLLWASWRLIVAPGVDTAMAVLLSFALALIAFYARAFALRVQDRVIRLEMRLRLQSLMPADQRARINELSVAQCVALRFASDAELPGLVSQVLASNLQSKKEIKRLIKSWTADHVRA